MLRGRLDEASRRRISGWAQDDAYPDVPVSLLITADGILVARVLANLHRPDLQAAGIGRGRHGFGTEIGIDRFQVGLSAVSIRAFRELDGAELDNSPLVVHPTGELDGPTRERIASILAATDEAALIDRIDFLAAQTDALLDRLAAIQGGRLQREQHRALRRRWSSRTGAIDPPPTGTSHVLVVSEATPTPDREFGSAVLVRLMRGLRRLGHRVAFIAADARTTPCPDLAEAGVDIGGPPFDGSVEEVLRRRGDGLDLVVLHRQRVASRYAPLVRHHCARARIVYAVDRLEHLRLERQATAQSLPDLDGASRRVRHDEAQAARAADLVIAHTSVETERLMAARANGVHLVAPSVAIRSPATPAASRHGIGFVGGHGQAHNRDAVRWLTADIMPRVWRRAPHVECLLAGEAATGSLPLSDDPRLIELGHLPSLDTLLDRVRLTVAPLAFGAGLHGKVLDSLGAGVPCVCSPVAAEGLDLPPPLACLIGVDAASIADLIVELHEAPTRLDALGVHARAYVAERFSEPALDAGLSAMLAPVLAGRAQAS